VLLTVSQSISACNVLLTVRHVHGHYNHQLLTVCTLYFADGHEMVTLIATKLLLLTNQPKLTLTVTLSLTDTVT